MSCDMLSKDVVNTIKEFIKEKRTDETIKAKFPNKLLRDDVLDLLDMYCTVVYYPLNNETNNGFHITRVPTISGEELSFVYINTAQTVEKQVFTAAHELGHIWNVDLYVAEKNNIILDSELREDIINRFAAELLMPDDDFHAFLRYECKKYCIHGNQISYNELIRVIVSLMSRFYTPYKSVIYRMRELNILEPENAELLINNNKDLIFQIENENGMYEFLNPTRLKWIDGLAQKLDKAEKEGTVSVEKIKKIREMFDIPKNKTTNECNKKLMVNINKSEEDNDA